MLTSPRRAHSANAPPARIPRLLIGVVAVLIALAGAYTSYLWARYLVDIDVAGLVGQRAGRDFRAFSVAGSLAALRDVANLYVPSSVAYTSGDAAAFVYPPWFAIGMIPFSLVGFQVGYWVWLAMTVGAGALGLWLVHRRSGLAAFGVMLVTAAGFQTVLFGQSAFLLLGLASIVTWAMVADRRIVLGGAAAFMAFKPHLIVGLGILLVWRRSRFRTSIVAALVVSVFLYAVSAVLLPGSLSGWIRLVLDSPDELVAPTAEVTLASAIRLLLGDGGTGTIVVVAVALGGVGWLAWMLTNKDLNDARLVIAAFGMSVVASPHALFYDVLLLVPGLVLLWTAEPPARSRIALYGGATLALLTIGPVFVNAQLEATGHAIAVGPIALAIFVAWAVGSASSPRVVRESPDVSSQTLSGGVETTDT